MLKTKNLLPYIFFNWDIFAYHKFHSSEVYTLVAFKIFTKSCNHRRYLISECFYHLERNPFPLAPHFLPHWSLWEPPIYFLSLWISLPWSYNVRPFASGFFHPTCVFIRVHPGCSLCQYFFPLIAECYSVVWTGHMLLIRSPVDDIWSFPRFHCCG